MKETIRVLVINTGSTSTKAAYFENGREVAREDLTADETVQRGMDTVLEELDLREREVLGFLERVGIEPAKLGAVACRGGILPPCRGGAYWVNQLMVDVLTYAPGKEHASNLSCMIGRKIADRWDIPAMIYDAPTVDEMPEIAHLTGLPELRIRPMAHVLNSRCVCRAEAERLGKPYEECGFIVAHCGGGSSVTAHEKGRLIWQANNDIGAMSPQRAGRLPTGELVDLCFSGQFDRKQLQRRLGSRSGFAAWFGTQDARQVESMIRAGDPRAELVYSALAVQNAQMIGEAAAVMKGAVDRIILTGGMAYSQRLTGQIRGCVEWIAPVSVHPGERELEGLAQGALRVLQGREQAKEWNILPAGCSSEQDFYEKYANRVAAQR